MSDLVFDRLTCGNRVVATELEWLVTNGLGSYASGTVSGIPTRRYHGLLIAALRPPLERMFLLQGIEETIIAADNAYPLFARPGDQPSAVTGLDYLDRFALDGKVPVWRYICGDVVLEKRLWMRQHVNMTCIQYSYVSGSRPIKLCADIFINYRDHHDVTFVNLPAFEIKAAQDGFEANIKDSEIFLHFRSPGSLWVIRGEWSEPQFLSIEHERGLPSYDRSYLAAALERGMNPGESCILVAFSGVSSMNTAAYEDLLVEQLEYEHNLLSLAQATTAPWWVKQLIQAADQFIVTRKTNDEGVGKTIIAGYHWFTDWGRDTMISLPGLALSTGRYDDAARILVLFAHFADRGMIPNRFPDDGERPEYNTVDATLWYFEAIRDYVARTNDTSFIQKIYPVLEDIINWHVQGTRFGIKLDAKDGLLASGEAGVQLTWMDVKIGDWVVTPRTGKAVEINALWFNALRSMEKFSELIGASTEIYAEMSHQTRAGFQKFWYATGHYCYDVIDTPEGDDPTLRPNQLIASSIYHSPLDDHQIRSIVDICARKLYTPYGLRSLDPEDPRYVNHYIGDQPTRDAAYHQGTVWGWLIGPYLFSHYKIYRNIPAIEEYLKPFIHHLQSHGVGTISEIFDGASPHQARGCLSQAWSVAELIRVWELLCSEGSYS